jgi:hypothetical protein
MIRPQCPLCGAFLPRWKEGVNELYCTRCGAEFVRG